MNAALLTPIVARLEKILSPDDELQGWSIVRSAKDVKVVLTYRSGCTHSITISAADPEFIHASL